MRALKQIFGKHRAQAVKMINTYRYLVTQIRLLQMKLYRHLINGIKR